MVSRRGQVLRSALAATLFVTAGCELDRVTVPATDGPMVVHAVLDPNSAEYVVLVEETLTGRVTVDTGAARDTLDPIVASGGIPVRDAIVTIVGSGGVTGTGIEDALVRADGRGKGVYRLLNRGKPFLPPPCPSCLPVNRGDTYALTVTSRGRTVTGRTTVPTFVRANPSVPVSPTFNRDRDVLDVTLPALEGEARWLVRVGSPYGPFALFTDSTDLRVPGTLRNVFAEDFPPAFVPGFRQSIIVAAVDTNYFDYYRSQNSPFTGAGLISHLQGGTGVFGSIVRVTTTRVDITADFKDPVDGRYVGGFTGADTLTLYVGDRVTDARLVSGSLVRVLQNGLGTARSGVLGALQGGTLSLGVLRGDVAQEVEYTLTGAAGGDVLTFAYGAATLTFRRAP